MKKIIFFILISMLIIHNQVYASYILYTQRKMGTIDINEDSKYYNLADIVLDIVNTDVKFNEDDKNYIFIVKQSFEANNVMKNYQYSNIRTEVALAEFSTINTLSISGKLGSESGNSMSRGYNDAEAKIGGTIIAKFYESDKYSDNTGTNEYKETKYCNKTFFLTDLFFHNICTKKNMDYSPHKVKVDKKFTYELNGGNKNGNYYKFLEFKLNVEYKITIDKNDFENYRYLGTYVPEAFCDSNQGWQYNEQYKIYNLGSRSIDLKPYIEAHNHDFKIRNVYKDYHELYCEGCEWVQKINHEYVDTYDNIEKNLCVCGRHKYVNIHIENNYDGDVYNKKLEVDSNFPKYEIVKKGQHLKSLKIVSKNYNKDTDVSSGSGSIKENIYVNENEFVLPNKVPNVSTSYYYNYDINKYSIVFNKKNNKDIKILDNIYMNNMIYKVNESKKLSKNKFVYEGYDFIGWCDDEERLVNKKIKDEDKVKYIDEEKLLNVTYENDAVINLYPVFKIIKYTITYKNNINGNILKKSILDINTNEEFPEHTKFGINIKSFSFDGYFINNKKVSNTTNGLINYITSDGKGNGSNIDVVACFHEKNSKDDYSDGPIIDDDNNNGVNDNENKDNNDINSGNENTDESDISKDNNNQNIDSENDNKKKLEPEDNEENKEDDEKKKVPSDTDKDSDNNNGENNDENGDVNNLDTLDDDLLDNNLKDNESILDKIISNIKDVFDNLIKGIKDVIKNIIKTISKFLDDYNLTELKNIIKNVFSSIKSFMSGLMNAIKEFTKNIYNFISPFINTVISALKKVFSKIWSILCSFYDKLLDIFGDFNSSIMIFISMFTASLISIYYLILFIIYIIEKKRESMRKNT